MKFYHPIGKVVRISSPYGNRVLNGKTQFHPALDFAVPVGTEVYASADGEIIKDHATNAAGVHDGYGHVSKGQVKTKNADIEIRHANGWCTRYSHLSDNFTKVNGERVELKVGDKVVAGQLIGLSGDAGTGPHLHYEIKKKAGYGTWFWKQFGQRIEVDPAPLLTLNLKEVSLT